MRCVSVAAKNEASHSPTVFSRHGVSSLCGLEEFGGVETSLFDSVGGEVVGGVGGGV